MLKKKENDFIVSLKESFEQRIQEFLDKQSVDEHLLEAGEVVVKLEEKFREQLIKLNTIQQNPKQIINTQKYSQKIQNELDDLQKELETKLTNGEIKMPQNLPIKDLNDIENKKTHATMAEQCQKMNIARNLKEHQNISKYAPPALQEKYKDGPVFLHSFATGIAITTIGTIAIFTTRMIRNPDYRKKTLETLNQTADKVFEKTLFPVFDAIDYVVTKIRSNVEQSQQINEQQNCPNPSPKKPSAQTIQKQTETQVKL